MKIYHSLAILVLAIDLTGCAEFGSMQSSISAGSTRAAPEAPVASSDAEVGIDKTVAASSSEVKEPAVKAPEMPASNSAENKLALADCLNQWPGIPEAPELAKKAVVVELNNFASGDLVYEDQKQTTEPVMYLLNINFDIPKSGRMELRNKNAWYCVAIRTKTVNVFDIGVSCAAPLATATKPGQFFDRFNILRDSLCS